MALSMKWSSSFPLHEEEQDLLNGFGALHPDIPVFECSKCKLLFSQISKLKRHNCLGVLNEPERELRRKRRLVRVRGMTPEEELQAEHAVLNPHPDLKRKGKRRRKPRLEPLRVEDEPTSEIEECSNDVSIEYHCEDDEEIQMNSQNETEVHKEEITIEIKRSSEHEDSAAAMVSQLNDVSIAREDDAIGTVEETKRADKEPKKRQRKKTDPVHLVCNVCGKQCRKPYELRLHMRGHDNDRPFECSVCHKRFVSKCYLNKHTRDVHDASHLKCKECCVGFQSKEKLREHCEHRSHHIQWPYQCTDCDKSFPKRSVLIAHQRQHEGERPFKCAHCTAAFFRKSALDQHSWLHAERPFACEQCSSRFLTKHLLNIHMMDHTGQRPYLCDTCGQRFKTKAQLRHHSEVHAEGLAFVCDVCGKKFKWKNNLVKHARKHAAGEQALNLFPCTLCHKSYTNKQGLAYHIMTHTGERPFQCSHCGRSFRGAGHLRKHMKHMHQDDPTQSASKTTQSLPPETVSVLQEMPAYVEEPRPSELSACTVDASLLGIAPLLSLDVSANLSSEQNVLFNAISDQNL